MCGIVVMYHPTQNIPTQALLRRYLNQRQRGIDGYGFAYVTDEGKVKFQRFAYEASCFHALSRIYSKCVMFHHRHPTSTKNNPKQNHPIPLMLEKKGYLMVHNGIISNAQSLRTWQHKDREYSTEIEENDPPHITTKKFNDSESLLHELALHLDEKTEIRARGSVAFVMMECDAEGKMTKLHFGRNESNPLYHHVEPGTGLNIIASDIEELTHDKRLPVNTLHTLDWHTMKISTSPVTIPTTYSYEPPVRGKRWGALQNLFPEIEKPVWVRGRYQDAGKVKADLTADERATLRSMILKDYIEIMKVSEQYLDWFAEQPWEDSSAYQRNIALGDICDLIRDLNNHSHMAYNGITKSVQTKLDMLEMLRTGLLPKLEAPSAEPIKTKGGLSGAISKVLGHPKLPVGPYGHYDEHYTD